MKKLKQCCLSLFLLLSFFVGSSWGVNVAYAYEGNPNEGHYPVIWHGVDPDLTLRSTNWNTIQRKISFGLITNQNSYFASFGTATYRGVGYIVMASDATQLDFNYVPDLYDYYFLGTVNGSVTLGFCADSVELMDYQCDKGHESHPLQDLRVYHHDDTDSTGFTVFGKFPDASSLCNTDIYGFIFKDDSGGFIDTALRFEGLIIALPKGNDSAVADILKTLENINSNIVNQGQTITSAVHQAVTEITKTVEEQYKMEEGEDFGVGGIVDQVEDRMGVLSFGADVLNDFLGLFSPGTVAGTVITLPAFAMEIGGETYNIWQDLSYDLTELESQFGFLIDIIRTFLVAMVWLAVLKYIVNSAESFWKG